MMSPGRDEPRGEVFRFVRPEAPVGEVNDPIAHLGDERALGSGHPNDCALMVWIEMARLVLHLATAPPR